MEKKKPAFKMNWILRNLILAVVFVVGIILLLNFSLSLITQHNKEKTVPDLTNMSFSEARKVASAAGLEAKIIDSVFIRRMGKGLVYSQFPKAGSVVKAGRTVELTTNAVNSKKVTMPLLVGYSMRQAKAELTAKGLFLGKLRYVPDIATNNVLKQTYKGREISAGTQLESGSVIDLTVGLDASESTTTVPDVIGLKYQYAVDAVQNNSLNIARAVFDRDIRNYSDSLNAVVYRQQPSRSSGALTMGSGVTIFLTRDESKIPSSGK